MGVIFEFLTKLVASFLTNKVQGKTAIDVEIPLGKDAAPEASKVNPPVPNMTLIPSTAIDWSNPDYSITAHFSVKDALTLHAWNRLANESDGLTDEVKANIVSVCNKMEEIRSVLGCAITVHCIYRSPDYNAQVVKAIPHDVHSMGMAVDFDCNGHHTIDEIHTILEPLLEKLGIRMEQKTPTWVHIDIHPVGHARYFLAA